jgi:hypothetical protein
VPEVQIHEPVLTLSDAAALEADFTAAYGAFAEVPTRRDHLNPVDDVLNDALYLPARTPLR